MEEQKDNKDLFEKLQDPPTIEQKETLSPEIVIDYKDGNPNDDNKDLSYESGNSFLMTQRDILIQKAIEKLQDISSDEINTLMKLDVDHETQLQTFQKDIDLQFRKFDYWKKSLIKMTKDAPQVWIQYGPNDQTASFSGDAKKLMSGPNGKFIPIKIKCNPRDDVVWTRIDLNDPNKTPDLNKIFWSVTAYVSGWEKDSSGDLMEDTLVIKSCEKSTANNFWSKFDGKVHPGDYVKLMKGKDMENAAITSAMQKVFGEVAGVNKVPLKMLEECGIDLDKITKAYGDPNAPASDKQLSFILNIAKRIIKKPDIKELESLIFNTEKPMSKNVSKKLIENTKDLSDKSVDQSEYVKSFKKYIE